MTNPPSGWLVLKWPRLAGYEVATDTIAGKFLQYYESQPAAMCYERLVEWIKSERQPRFRNQETITAEPLGWREYIAQKYPAIDFPDREKFEDGPWLSVPAYYKKMICVALTKKSA